MSFIDKTRFPNEYLDPFGSVRVSNRKTIFDSTLVGDNRPLLYDDLEVSGSGTNSDYTLNESSVKLKVSASTAGRRVRQTFRRFAYQPGKGQRIQITGVLGDLVSGNTKRIGIFDDENGLFFENTGSEYNLVVRSFTSGVAVDTQIPQSAPWNIDRMDGTGPSGITLDFTKSQIFFIDFEWLGVGTVAFGFVIDRALYYVHFQNHANITSGVYMTTPNLPIRYEIENDGTGATDEMECICASVESEGGREIAGFPRSLNRGTTPYTTGNNSNIHSLFAIRLKSGFLGADINIGSFSVNCTSTASYNYYFLLNPTVSGPGFSWTSLPNSAIEYDITRTNTTTLSGGTILFSGSSSQQRESSAQGAGLNDRFGLGADYAGNQDVLVLAVQRVVGASEIFYGGLNWTE